MNYQTNVIVPHCVGVVYNRRPDPNTEAGMTQLAALAICRAMQNRGAVEIRDLTQAGLTKADAERLYDTAMARAKRMDPSLFRAAA